MAYFDRFKVSLLPQNCDFPRWVGLVTLLLIFLFVGYLHWQETGAMSPQSKANIAAAEKPCLSAAIKEYPKCWPPLYPASLWGFAKMGLPVRMFNLLCFFGTLLALWIFSSKFVSGVSPAVPVLLIAINHANYPSLYQQTSESLFLLLSLIVLLALACNKKRPSVVWVAILGIYTAAASLTRFFGIVWLIPLALMYLTLFTQAEHSSKRKVAYILIYLAPICFFVLPWLLLLKFFTGSFTGMDRTAIRLFPPGIAYRNDLTDFTTNIAFVFKTVFIDFFSPSRYASHIAVHLSEFTSFETLTLFAVTGIVLYTLFLILRKASGPTMLANLRGLLTATNSVPLHFTVVYIAAMIVVWTYSNNDPIRTRFMFPSYPFIILTVLCIFSWVKARSTKVWELFPFYLLGVLYALNNVLNIASGLTTS